MTTPEDPVRRAIENAQDLPPAGGASPPWEEPDGPGADDDPESNVVSLHGRRDGRKAEAKDDLTDRDKWWRFTQPRITWGDDGLPEGCPVLALGRDGEVCNYLDVTLNLVSWLPKDHSRNGLVTLFGGNEFLRRIFPRFSTGGTLQGFRPEEWTDHLIAACTAAGHWSADERVRGPGAWKDDDGGLILHCGDAVLIGDGFADPGLHEGYLYPATRPGPRPSRGPLPEGGDHGPGMQLLEKIRSWNWKRGAEDVDPSLMLGWIVAGMFGGALDWRPLLWVTGTRGTGKSTLQALVKAIVQGGTASGIISVSDTTAAGIWQKVQHSTYPIGLDEIEAKDDNRKVQAVVGLARQAASGGVILRGGADHKGSEFTARSCFFFSSILIPPLLGQDLSRLAILELSPLEAKAQLVIDEEELGALGCQIRRRFVEAWPQFPQILGAFRDVLIRVGKHDARGADQFGTLLACFWVAVYDGQPSAKELDNWGKWLSVAHLQALTDETSDEVACRNHLLGFVDREMTGGRAIGELIDAVCRPAVQESFDDAGPAPDTHKARAEEMLFRLGLRVVFTDPRVTGEVTRPSHLAIANRHTGLARIFNATHWQAQAGAAGVWRQAFARLSGADNNENVPMAFAGKVTSKVIRLPIEQVWGVER